MADSARMTNGDDVPNLTVTILQDIREELRGLRGLATETNERLDQTNERLGQLERTTALGFERVIERMENLRDLAGDRYRDHEERLRRIEMRLDMSEPR